MTGQYSCHFDLYLRSCTGTNSGDECTPNNYYTSSKCVPRTSYIHSCVKYASITTDTESDPGCSSCIDGR